MLARAWKSWRRKSRLLAPGRVLFDAGFYARTLHYLELDDTGPAGRTELRPYEGLASLWHDHAGGHVSDYPAYLADLARDRKLRRWSVLDLACGTGTMAARLAGSAAEVVGLDASAEMLADARARCAALPGVRFTPGDFRDFKLDRRFDFVLCASNSLNYVAGPGDLAAVLRGAAAHLRPGGSFVFDTQTSYGMAFTAGLHYHRTVGGRRFVIRPAAK